jgi:hypothetical protein
VIKLPKQLKDVFEEFGQMYDQHKRGKTAEQTKKDKKNQ